MIDAGVQGVEFFALNTDAQALNRSKAPIKLQIGQDLAAGRGAGADPRIGEESAREAGKIHPRNDPGSRHALHHRRSRQYRTGAAPISRKLHDPWISSRSPWSHVPSCLKVPSACAAPAGLGRLRQYVDTCLIISNDKLLSVVDKKSSLSDAFEKANEVLRVGLTSISDLISVPGLINVDYADMLHHEQNRRRRHGAPAKAKAKTARPKPFVKPATSPCSNALSLKAPAAF